MKKILLIVLLSVYGLTSYAQTLDIPKDTINGKVVWLYPVQKSEGLYRISKNFGVSQEDIINLNPELKTEGLKLGQVIKIPVIQTIDSTLYVVHELQPKETLYGLSKKYGVKQSEIEKLNPKTVKRMEIGKKLLIKLKDKQDIVTTPQLPTIDTTKVSAMKDSVTALPKQELPKQEQPNQEQPKQEQPNPDSIAIPTQGQVVAPTEAPTPIPFFTGDERVMSGLPIRLAVMLPFMTNQTRRDENNDRFVDFYEGVLLAVNEAQKAGQKLEIYTYDIEKSETKLNKVLEQPELMNVDAIIGPAYPQQVSVVSKFAFEKKIPVLVPFTNRVSDIKTNPYLIQFNVSEEKEAEVFADTLSKWNDIQIVAIQNDGLTETDASIMRLMYNLKDKAVEITKVSYKQLSADSLEYFLQPDKRNLIIFPTDKYSKVQVWMQKISDLSRRYNICLLGQYAWQKEQLPQNIHFIYTSVFHKPQSTALSVLTYNLQRSYYFKHERISQLPYYDMLGYDLTAYLIRMLQEPTESLSEKIAQTGEYEGMQSVFRFEPVEGGGFENVNVEIINR